MPPTLKDSSAFPTSPEKLERASEISSSSAEFNCAQPVALEVPVTVNGTRAVESSDKREPFSETTNTVLVLANGAVIRLLSSVAPGQLLFLTNDKTRKEVVCQVVKSKNYRSASGYVELEFTEPVLGFWGVRFPGDRSTAGAGVAPARKPDPVAAVNAPKSAEPKAAPYADLTQPAENVTSNLPDAVQEFKTDIKADARPTSKADFLAPAEKSIDGLKLEASRLQEQLSALLFTEQKKSEAKSFAPVVPQREQEEVAAKVLEIAGEEPASAKLPTAAATPDAASGSVAKSRFDAEEVKIPAWLEPLARNADVHVPAKDEDANDFTGNSDDWHAADAMDLASSQKPAPTTTVKPSGAPGHKARAAVFGNSLLGEASPELSEPRGSGRGIWLMVAAGLLLAAASGVWYFRDSLGLSGQGRNSSQSTPLSSNAAAVTPAVPMVDSAQPTAAVTKSSAVNPPTETSAATSLPTQGKVQAAAITERIPRTSSGGDLIRVPEKSVEVVEPAIKKPSLGIVHLAKPKISRSPNVLSNSAIEPTFGLSGGTGSAEENSLGGNFANTTRQPAAPVAPAAVGGDVKPARMISSVPPNYPALAKAQHVAGSVRVDALIDDHGRVTTMKVVSGPSLLHQAAMDALRQWKYLPATLDGKPVPMHLTVTIQFRLQ